jgi:hypothetical protein
MVVLDNIILLKMRTFTDGFSFISVHYSADTCKTNAYLYPTIVQFAVLLRKMYFNTVRTCGSFACLIPPFYRENLPPLKKCSFK